MVVRFPDVAMRDAVRSAAFNLAGKKAGIRLEIPDALRPSLKALESTAYHLKQSNPGMKRNVKFDDEVQNLVMDVKLDEDGTWRKIRPAQAQAARAVSGADNGGEEMGLDELQTFMSFGGSGSSTQGPATGANACPQGS